MELQRLSKVVTSPENLDSIITKFYRELFTQLSLNNGFLQTSCLENSEQIKVLRLRKYQLLQSICNMTSLHSKEYIFVFHLNNNNELWKHSLQFGLKKVSEGVVRHNKSCKEWKSAAELKLQVIQDDFTMMPFHDVEMEINTINLEIINTRTKIKEITEKTEASHNALEAEFEQLLHDVATMEKYKMEIRKSEEHLNQALSEIKRQQQLDAFHANIGTQKILQIQKDIEELQKQINTIQQFQSE